MEPSDPPQSKTRPVTLSRLTTTAGGSGNAEEADNEVHGVDATSSSQSSTSTSKPRSTMQIPRCMMGNASLCASLTEANIDLPCTTATLRELDLHSIQHNLNLRIDINYDHDLYFQPISGRKGEVKRSAAAKYWRHLAAELIAYRHEAPEPCRLCQAIETPQVILFEQHLPVLFDNLKEIVQMLVPESEHDEVAEHLDSPFLMQQVFQGAFDIGRFGDWLTTLLTRHCAPMRDNLAMEVAQSLRDGAAEVDMDKIVGGIEKLFSLLEAMKLDVANHQIRAFRFPLIEDTVAFQRDCFTRAIESNQIDLASAQTWFQQAYKNRQNRSRSAPHNGTVTPFHGYIHGLVGLCDPDVKEIPSTFQYDHQRFVRLQEELQDLVQIHLCLDLFNRLVARLCGPHPMTAAKLRSVYPELQARIIFLTEDEEGNGGAISDHLDAIGMEIMRAAKRAHNPDAGAAAPLTEMEVTTTVKKLRQTFDLEDRSQIVTKSFAACLEQLTLRFATEFLALPTLDISNVQKRWSHARSLTTAGNELLLADKEDMARRLAHIGVIHWRVWAELCYLNPSVRGTEEAPSPSSSQPEELAHSDILESCPPADVDPRTESDLCTLRPPHDLPTERLNIP